jgi:hypothetical protein
MELLTKARVGLVPMAATALTASLLLAGCSSTSSSSGSGGSASSESTSSTPVPSAPPAQTVAIGATATLPADTITVTAFTDKVVPKATKPSEPATHWASAAVKQCATGASSQGKWELALASGDTAPEPTSWTEGELPHQLQPSNDRLAAGDCVSGNVYFVVPDGATATGVVLKPTAGTAARPQVTWTVS